MLLRYYSFNSRYIGYSWAFWAMRQVRANCLTQASAVYVFASPVFMTSN